MATEGQRRWRDGWLDWLLRWLAATTMGSLVFTGVYFAAAGADDVRLVLWPFFALMGIASSFIFLPLLLPGLVLPMTVVAWALRGLWRLLAPRGWRDAVIPAVLGGAASGPSGLLLMEVAFRLRTGGTVALARALDVWLGLLSFAPVLMVGGAVAGYLAHRRVSPVSLRWWLAVFGAAVAGVLLQAPLDPELPWL